MKHLKKIVSLLLTAVMVLAMCIPVMADDVATAAKKYTITAPATNHIYEIYQIFTGDLNNGVLSNVKWGENGTGTRGIAVDESVLNALVAIKDSTSDREKLNVVENYAKLDIAPIATVTNSSTYEANPGYYLIKDQDDTVNGLDAYTTYIVRVVGDVTIQAKSSVPSFEKKLKDTNDTTGATSGWQDSADYDIGDKIPFQLKGTVASNYDDYKTYYFAFHDKEEAALTFDASSVVVKVDNTKITSGYEVKTSGKTHNDCTFEVIFKNLKDITSVHAGSVITVEYESTLNDAAKLGAEGNVNEAKLEFSNNPNEEQNGEDKPGTGETPWDNVIVFTYKVVINKVNENKVPLAGAEFTLSKKLADGSTVAVAVVKSNSGTTFTFSGLDDGDYTLTETKTPDEYNTIAPITFRVTADHKITWDSGNRETILTELNGNKVSGEITFTHDESEGSLSADVVNKKGSSLPSTGGIGTTIFYVVGVILMLGAGVLLVTKKRMSSNR